MFTNLPYDTIYGTVTVTGDEARTKTFSVPAKGGDVVKPISKLVEDLDKHLKSVLGDEDVSGDVKVSFKEDATHFISSKAVLNETSAVGGMLSFISNELLVLLNTENFENKHPFVLLPVLGSDKDEFGKLLTDVDAALEHLQKYQSLSLKTEGSIVPPVELYIEDYGLATYSVVVMFGFLLRSLIRERNVDADESLRLFAEVASNMVHPGVWGLRASQLPTNTKKPSREVFEAVQKEAHKLEETGEPFVLNTVLLPVVN